MPQRFLKPGITNSERWNGVSWQAQSLYIRLLTVVDDYGRYDGRSAVIHGTCFSLYNAINPENPVKLQETDKMLQEIAASHLIELYDAEGKRVMQLTQWTERIRDGVKEKWPSQTLLQLPATSCKNLPSPSPSPSPSSPSITPSGISVPEKLGCNSEFINKWTDWMAIRRQMKKCKDFNHLFQEQINWLNGFDVPKAIEILSQSIRNGWQGLFEPKGTTGTAHSVNGNGKNGAQIVAWTGELDRVLAKMKSIRGQYMDHQTWEAKDRTRFSELGTRKKELQSLLGVKE